MKKKLKFYVQIGVTVVVDVATDEELKTVIAEHQTALYNGISLDSNIDGSLRVSDVELAGSDDL